MRNVLSLIEDRIGQRKDSSFLAWRGRAINGLFSGPAQIENEPLERLFCYALSYMSQNGVSLQRVFRQSSH